MSHSEEREEKICLNCNAALYGRYCHVCGQENIEPRQSAWHLITHFFYDITHFDGKFFTTLKDLLVKPGFLSSEYIKGKRMSYLHPIRMYVFTSAFFFIIFFSLFNAKNLHIHDNTKKAQKQAEIGMQEALKGARTKEDSLAIENALGGIKNMNLQPKIHKDSDDNEGGIGFSLDSASRVDRSVSSYDSAQDALPPAQRDSWLKRLAKRKTIDLNVRYKDNSKGLMEEFMNVLLHNFPKLLFVSLPVFALLLELLYIRRRKQFYYADHGIFAIHVYIYSFISLLFIFAINAISNLTGWKWLWLFNLAIILYTIYYYYKAMRNFYRQGRAKTFFKYMFLLFFSFIAILVLFVFFLAFSIMEV